MAGQSARDASHASDGWQHTLLDDAYEIGSFINAACALVLRDLRIGAQRACAIDCATDSVRRDRCVWRFAPEATCPTTSFVGCQISTLTSESVLGVSVAATRQNSGSYFAVFA